MQRLVNFTSLAGTLVGAATGGVFTPFGIPFGAFAGAVLGLLAGCFTAPLIEHDSGLTLPTARLRLTAPPLILLTAAALVATAWIGVDLWPITAIAVGVAAPQSAAVTWLAAPWVVTLVRPQPADPRAEPAKVRALWIPIGVLLLSVLGWVVTFLLLTL